MIDDSPQNRSHFQALYLDYKRYQEQLDTFDLDQDEKKALLESLFQIAINFVDLGFGIHPTQQACGKHRIKSEQIPTGSNDSLYWNQMDLRTLQEPLGHPQRPQQEKKEDPS